MLGHYCSRWRWLLKLESRNQVQPVKLVSGTTDLEKRYIFALIFMYKIENGNGESVKETTTRPNKKTTAEGHQQVFDVARNSRTRRLPSAGP